MQNNILVKKKIDLYAHSDVYTRKSRNWHNERTHIKISMRKETPSQNVWRLYFISNPNQIRPDRNEHRWQYDVHTDQHKWFWCNLPSSFIKLSALYIAIVINPTAIPPNKWCIWATHHNLLLKKLSLFMIIKPNNNNQIKPWINNPNVDMTNCVSLTAMTWQGVFRTEAIYELTRKIIGQINPNVDIPIPNISELTTVNALQLKHF